MQESPTIRPMALAAAFGMATKNGAAVARQIRTGTIGVNGHGADFSAPFGGFKQSGLGREFGDLGLSHYVEYQSVFL